MMSQGAHNGTHLREASFRKIRRQVASILLEHARHAPRGVASLSQAEMASILGTSWGLINRSLASLQEEGAIRIVRNRIICNERTLQEVPG